MDTISPVYARFVLREILRRGIPETALFAGTSLGREALESAGDIAMGDFLRILDNGRRLSGNEQLGLMLGRRSQIIALGPIGAAAAIAPNLREGLQVLENYTRLHVSYIRMKLISSLGGLSVRVHYLQDTGEMERFHTETAVMLLQNYAENMLDEILTDLEIRMAIPRPGYAAEYAKWIHGDISFGWDVTSIEIPARWLDLPSPYYNAELWHQATLTLARSIRDLEGTVERPYMQYVDALMRSCEPPLPDLAAVAHRLHMSERTLNRRLQQEDTSFRQIRSGVLARWARQLLEDTDDTVESISATLGYRDTANFRRAFRNREGCSPGEYRRST